MRGPLHVSRPPGMGFGAAYEEMIQVGREALLAGLLQDAEG